MKRALIFSAALISLILGACVSPGAARPDPTKSLETWGMLWDWSPPPCAYDASPCTFSGPVDTCASVLNISFPMTDEATRKRYFDNC